jgi:thiol-disulfide isomerase/thioredoxin
MPALNAGVVAPDFTLPTVQGEQVSLREAFAKGPVVLVFFKKSCPVCQYALPLLERMFQANRAADVTKYGVSFPVVLDDPANYAVSNAYGLTNVPTIFYIAPSGEIEVSCVGWSKAEVEVINRKLAEYRNQPPVQLWHKGEDIQDFRAG